MWPPSGHIEHPYSIAGIGTSGGQWLPSFTFLSDAPSNNAAGCRLREGRDVNSKTLMVLGAAVAVATALVPSLAAAQSTGRSGYEPVLNPANFVRKVNNPYFTWPVGRTLTYRGVRDGQTQVDVVHVTSKTKVIEGITTVTVTDVATHQGKLLEKTTDWYAQDKQGNVWYLGEATAVYLPGGKVDHSGSWQAGIKDAEPGLVMEAHPKVPDAY